MIAEVRRAVAALGVAGVDDLRAETGIPAREVETALAYLVERGYLREVDPDELPSAIGPAAGAPAGSATATVCRSCPLQVACPSARPPRGHRKASCGIGTLRAGARVWIVDGARQSASRST